MPRNQTELEGMEAPRIKAIDEAAEHYVSVRDKRMKLTASEIAAKQNLIDTCREHEDKLSHDGNGVIRYAYDDMVVEWERRDKIRVRHATSEPADVDD
jgi:hypothetical protein